MNAWQRRYAEGVASHPVIAAVLAGCGWGLLFWLGFGLGNHALSLRLFIIAMSGGIVLCGPIYVVLIRRRRSRPN